MKYLVFAGDRHQSAGGMRDCIGSSNDIEEAKNVIKRWYDQASLIFKVYFAWAHIWDCEIQKFELEVSDTPLGIQWYKGLHLT